jgi:two-component system, NarL family, response regulator LiaR
MSKKPIKLLVVDDQNIVRKGIRALLEQVDDIDVIGEASNGEEAVAQAKRLHPDVILMDLMMPKMDGITAIREIQASQLPARVIALTSFVTEDKVFPAIKAGAMGYLLKDSEPEDLITAIRKVDRGEPSLHPIVAKMVLEELGQPAQREQSLTPEPLTEREVDIIRLVAQGLSNRQIAEQLVIGEATVRTHVGNVLNKLHLANRVQATLYALREGLTSLDEMDNLSKE